MTESRLMAAYREGGVLGMTANGYEVSLGEDENVLKLDYGDNCRTL